MSTVLIIIIVVVVLLAVGGAVAVTRRTKARAPELHRQIQAADRALAEAHAEDKGWHRDTMEAAARQAFAARHGDAEIKGLHLVAVKDLPGTDEDEAVFRVETASGEQDLVLGRRGGDWVPA